MQRQARRSQAEALAEPRSRAPRRRSSVIPRGGVVVARPSLAPSGPARRGRAAQARGARQSGTGHRRHRARCPGARRAWSLDLGRQRDTSKRRSHRRRRRSRGVSTSTAGPRHPLPGGRRCVVDDGIATGGTASRRSGGRGPGRERASSSGPRWRPATTPTARGRGGRGHRSRDAVALRRSGSGTTDSTRSTDEEVIAALAGAP